MKKDWHEPELNRHLSPVKAPDELWDRIQGTDVISFERAQRPVRRFAMAWVTVAAVAVAAVAGTALWRNRNLSSEERAVRALARAPEQVEFRSGDLAEIRNWVKESSGLEVPLRGLPAGNVQLIGASLTRSGAPTAEIAYRVGNMDAALVISKMAEGGDGRHAFVKSGSYHGANFQSWTMRGEMFTIAAADARAGCMLCHSTGAPARL
jgi:anti-sigma factor RsiW